MKKNFFILFIISSFCLAQKIDEKKFLVGYQKDTMLQLLQILVQ